MRGNELITRTGCFGDIVREARRWEREGRVLAAAMMIGNPFTDVPELCSQLIVTAESETTIPQDDMRRLVQEFWTQRFRMQATLMPLDRAIAQAKIMKGPVVFTDAADATSSGASGDSNIVLRALLEAGYTGTVLAPIIDPAAAQAAMDAGVGSSIAVSFGWVFRQDKVQAADGRGVSCVAVCGEGSLRDLGRSVRRRADCRSDLRQFYRRRRHARSRLTIGRSIWPTASIRGGSI